MRHPGPGFAIGLLEVMQAHRLLGIMHPDIAERIGERRRLG
jgi:hypothetical protein